MRDRGNRPALSHSRPRPINRTLEPLCLCFLPFGRRCAAQMGALSSWWVEALQHYDQQRMWMQLGPPPSQWKLPSRCGIAPLCRMCIKGRSDALESLASSHSGGSRGSELTTCHNCVCVSLSFCLCLCLLHVQVRASVCAAGADGVRRPPRPRLHAPRQPRYTRPQQRFIHQLRHVEVIDCGLLTPLCDICV